MTYINTEICLKHSWDSTFWFLNSKHHRKVKYRSSEKLHTGFCVYIFLSVFMFINSFHIISFLSEFNFLYTNYKTQSKKKKNEFSNLGRNIPPTPLFWDRKAREVTSHPQMTKIGQSSSDSTDTSICLKKKKKMVMWHPWYKIIITASYNPYIGVSVGGRAVMFAIERCVVGFVLCFKFNLLMTY